MLEGLSEGKLVTPEIMADRYLYYRTNEYLLSYLDHKPRLDNLPNLPFESKNFIKYFPLANIEVRKNDNYYSLINLAKGGVFKLFSLDDNKLIYNDCGIIAVLDNKSKIVTSQWIENDYITSVEGNKIKIKGHLNKVPLKYFTPFKFIIFRSFLLLIGWNTKLSYLLKGFIRRQLVVGKRLEPIFMERVISFENDKVTISDDIKLKSSTNISALQIGDEFSVRFVPQSLYFQSQELGFEGFELTKDDIAKLNKNRFLQIIRSIDLISKKINLTKSI